MDIINKIKSYTAKIIYDIGLFGVKKKTKNSYERRLFNRPTKIARWKIVSCEQKQAS